MNRDTSGKSLSVVVRLYQLKDTAEFSKLTFDTVASGRPEAELLGPALLGKTDTIVVPGGTYDSTETLQEGARYVGVVALFRQPDPHFWRFLVDADEVRSNGMKFKVKDCYITLNGIKPLPIPGQPTTNYKPTCQNFGSVNAPTVTSTAAKAGQGTTKPPAQRRSAAPRSPLPDIGIAPGTTGTGSYGATVNIGISPSGNR